MKNSKIFLYAAMALSSVGMQSCLDYDTPGDEFQDNQIIVPPVISSGKADIIDYKKDISYAEANAAYKAMRSTLGTAQTGIYGLRGGKEGGLPGEHAYQFLNCLGPDNYVQYFCIPHSDFPYSNFDIRSTYDLCKGSIGGPGGGFSSTKVNIAPALNDENIEMLPEMKAIYLILFNYSAIENADLFGPMPYNDHKNLKETSPFKYDNVRTIYYSAKANLDSAVNCLKYFTGEHLGLVDKLDADGNPIYKTDAAGNKIVLKNVEGKDSLDADGNVVYETEKEEQMVPNRDAKYKKLICKTIIGARVPLFKFSAMPTDNLEQFIRFANSLKLRMAIHMTGVEPETAKKWAEEAVDPENGGVIETPEQEIAIYTSVVGCTHPLVGVTGWGDIVMGASFINLLENLDHPYMKYLFTKNSVDLAVKDGKAVEGSSAKGAAAESMIVGMRDGVTPGIGQAAASNPYCGYSMLDKSYLSQTMPPLYLMKLSEVCFLRAEGAIRGWNMRGSAKEFYEKGVRYAYFEDRDMQDNEYVKNVDAYLNVEAPKGIKYVDPQGITPDMECVTKVGVKWNDGDSNEDKLAKIITQKYIASFPYSYESWVDLRRTGYPKLFPVLGVTDGDGTIQAGDSKVQTADNIMRRIPWASDDPQTNKDIEATGLPALSSDTDGAASSDTQMQRLWWDNGASNF